MTHPSRRRASDDEGVSTVLGAILMFGLLIVTLVMIQVKFVPVWDEDAEAGHMREVRGQYATISSDLGRLVDNRTTVPITDPLTLDRGTSGFRFFGSDHLPGTATFNGDAADLTISSPRMRILEQNGQAFYGLTSAWTPVTGTATDDISGIAAVRSLRLRIDMHEEVCRAYRAQDTAVLFVYDANSVQIGRVVVTWIPASSSEYALKLDVYANLDNGAVADDQISSTHELFNNQICQGVQDNFLDYHYFDLLEGPLQFEPLLGSAAKPLSMQLRESGLVADYQLVYDTTQGSGGTTVGGGFLDPTWADPNNHRYPAGTLRFDSSNQRLPPQSFVLEHGAVILHQPDGDVMLIPPSFRVTAGLNAVTVDWTLPSLNAATQNVGGSHSASVQLDPTNDRIALRGASVKITCVISTAFPAVWETYLDTVFRAAGYTDGTHFTTVPGTNQVTLTVIGQDASDVGTDDVSFLFRQADVVVALRSAG